MLKYLCANGWKDLVSHVYVPPSSAWGHGGSPLPRLEVQPGHFHTSCSMRSLGCVCGGKTPLPSSTRSHLLEKEERLQIVSWNKPEMEKLLFSPDGSSHRSLTQRQLPYGSLESVSPNGNPKLNPTRHVQSSRLVVQCHSSGPLY